MGNADSSRASKRTGVLGGLLKRVKGDKKEPEEPAHNTGVSVRNRFSALEPVAVPTDAVPKKTSEVVSDPDAAKEVTVIHTSAVRSIRFSDRIGLDVGSSSEDTFERRISLEDDDEEEEESVSYVSEVDEDQIGRYGSDLECIDDDAEVRGTEEMIDISEDILTGTAAEEQIETVVEIDIGEEVPEPEVKAAAETKKEVKAEEVRKEVKAEVKAEPEIKAEIKAETRTVKIENEITDDFDGGYDFLPKRTATNMFAAMNRRTETQAAPVVRETPIKTEQRTPAKAPVTEKPAEKTSTLLAERMRARNADQQKRPSEIQADGPVQHESIFRTSLLEKVTKEGTSGKRVSDVIRSTEKKSVPQMTVCEEEAEVYDADVAVYEAPAAVENITRILNEESPDEISVEDAEIEILEADTEPQAAAEEIRAETVAEMIITEDAEADEVCEFIEEAEAEEIAAEIEAETETEYIEADLRSDEISEVFEAETDAECAAAEADADVIAAEEEIIFGTGTEYIEIDAEEEDASAELEAEDLEDRIEAVAEAEDIAAEAEEDPDVEITVSEAASEDVPDIEITHIEELPEETAEECSAEINDTAAEVKKYDPLEEIEADVPVNETCEDEARIDDAETELSAVSGGVIVDDEVIPAADAEICAKVVEEEAPETVSDEFISEIPEAEATQEEPSEIICGSPVIDEPVQEEVSEYVAAPTDSEVPAVACGTIPEMAQEIYEAAPELIYEGPDIPIGVCGRAAREAHDALSDAFSVCFSFLSEENRAPSVSMNFNWGQ